jgi:hypothetical protein
MKKIVILIALFMAFSCASASAEIFAGFNGYAWGTDFKTIRKEVNLTYLQTREMGGENSGIKSQIYVAAIKKNRDPICSYSFVNNQLAAGQFVFTDKSKFEKAIQELRSKAGIDPSPKQDGGHYYMFQNILVTVTPNYQSSQRGSILYINMTLLSGAQEK